MIEQIYSRLICGGIGYSLLLFRVGRKYYTVRGDTDPENYRKLAAMDFHRKQNGDALFTKHQYDNVITAGEFLQIISRLTPAAPDAESAPVS